MAEKYVFYLQTDIPEKWALLDLLYWVSMDVIPHPFYSDYGVEGRQSKDLFEENMFEFGDFFGDVYFSPNETKPRGIPDDPRWKNVETPKGGGESLESVAHYDSMLRFFENSETEQAKDEIRKLKSLKQKAKILENEITNWKIRFSDFLDKYISKIVIDLREGKLVAEGIRINGSPDGDFNEEIYDNFGKIIHTQKEFDEAYESIPADLWVTRRIDWKAAMINADNCVFLGVRLNRDEALELYAPLETDEIALGVCGNGYVKSNLGHNVSNQVSNRGRPRKNWDQIHLKIAETISKFGKLPRKQDAFAEELSVWYTETTGKKIGLSTIKSRLKIYYDNPNFQKSEK